MHTKSWVFAVFMATFLGAVDASGQTSAADKAAADKLFEEGRALLEQNRLAEACPKFEESDRYDPSVGTRLNLGDCYERQGKTASAYGHFGDAARLARERGDRSREGVAEERRRALEARLSRIRVKAPANVPELQVHLDGKFMGQAVFGTALPVDPGKHEVQAWAPGRASFQEEVQVGPGPVTVEVEVPELFDLSSVASKGGDVSEAEAGQAARDALAAPKAGWTLMRGVGFATGIAGLVGVGAGVGFGVDALRRLDASEGACDVVDPTRCTLAGFSQRNKAGFSADVSTVMVGIGGAVLAAGVVLFVVGGNEKVREVPAQRAWVSPVVGRGIGGVSAGMEF